MKRNVKIYCLRINNTLWHEFDVLDVVEYEEGGLLEALNELKIEYEQLNPDVTVIVELL
jgi:hypothetical protein